MSRAFHNLDGFLRDLRRAIDAGDERAYAFAELVLETDDLINPSPDTQPPGAGDGEDDVLDADGGEGAGETSDDVVRQLEDDHPDSAGVVRVARSASHQQRLPLADPGGARGGPAVRRAPVLDERVLVGAVKGGRRRG